VALENLREMALVGETGVQGDLGQRQLRGSELAAGKFNPKPANIFPQGAAVAPPE
jgi:hypothetical protein